MRARSQSFPFLSLRKSTPTAPWAIVHRAVGDRPTARGRSPIGRWAFAHRAGGADFLRERNGKRPKQNGE